MEDSKKHHYDMKEDDCKTSSKEVIQDPMQHVGEAGRSQISVGNWEFLPYRGNNRLKPVKKNLPVNFGKM